MTISANRHFLRFCKTNIKVVCMCIGVNVRQDFKARYNLLYDASTIDAVPVVRCGECKWKSKCIHHKPEEGGIFEDNDFCSYGERKDGDSNA